MRFYSVHARAGRKAGSPSSPLGGSEELAFVPEGFSWMAALFTPFWMTWNRLWWPLAGYLLLSVLLGLASAIVQLADPADLLIGAAMAFLFGVEAAELRRWGLRRRGYEMRAMLLADDEAAAEYRYRLAEQAAPAPAPMASPAAPAALGPARLDAFPRLV